MRLSLGIKLGFWLALLGALSTALTGYYVYDRSRAMLIESSQEKLLTATQVLAQRFSGVIDNISADVNYLASLPEVSQVARRSGATVELQDQLADHFSGLLGTRNSYSQIRLIGAANYGRELVRIDRVDSSSPAKRVSGAGLQEKSHLPYFFETLRLPAGHLLVSQITLNQEWGAHHGYGRPTIRIAAPVYAGTGVALAVIVIDVDLGDLFNQLRAELPQDLDVLLSNQHGDYLIHPDADKTFGFNQGREFLIQSDLPDMAAMMSGGVQHTVLEIDDANLFGRQSLAAFVRVPFGELAEKRYVMLGLYAPLEEVLAKSNALGWSVIQLTLLFIALATLVALLLARMLAKPLNRMAQAVRDHSLGQPVTGLPLKRDDELGELARSFDSMATQLSAQMDAIKTAEARLHAILDNAPVGIWMVGVDGRYHFVNNTFCNAVGISEQRFLEITHLPDLMGEEDAAKCIKSDRECLTQEGVHHSQEILRFTDGVLHQLEVTKSKLHDSNGVVVGVIGIAVDVTERMRMEDRDRKRTRVLEQISEGAPLQEVLNSIVQSVESQLPDMSCSIMLVSDDGAQLTLMAAPTLPEPLRVAVKELPVGMSSGPCGSAAFTGQRMVLEDIRQYAANPPLRDLALNLGLGACWSEPIRSSSGKVLGTFAIYLAKAGRPTEAQIQLLEHTAHLASIAIEKKRAEAKLKLAASVFTHAREGIMITDAEGCIIEVNETFMEITGYTHAEVQGQKPNFLNSGHHDPEFYAAMWNSLRVNGYWSGEVWNRRKNGDLYAEMQTVSAVRDESGITRNYVALFSDITPMKEHERQLEHIAHYDVLTGLPNRVLKTARLQHAIVQCQRHNSSLAVAYLDLDGFKEVNDTYGHEVGDQLLIALSQRMKEALREGDTLARIGGDEFVAILIDLELPGDYETVLNRLLQAASTAIIVGDQQLKVSASIGVTLYPQDSVDPDLLLRHADQAMYLAKQAGKNRYHLFDIAHDMAVQSQHESIERIRRGLSQHEFVLYYQPKVNMRTGEVAGAEALIRWQHPERGLLAPGLFLPPIEEHSVSIELGEWVIDAAMRQMKVWQDAGLAMPVSVNIGSLQFQQPDFVTRLKRLLAVYPDVSPQQLELEVLETTALEDVEQVSVVIQLCHEIGIRFSLDDFGTGYSSLTYLKRLPVDVLKIDQSFVRDMLFNANDLAIIEGIIGLSKAFRREVIAEGVETVAHGSQLLKMGCELAQGYGIARPMPAAELPTWVNCWRPDAAWHTDERV